MSKQVRMTVSDDLLNSVDRMFDHSPQSTLYELHQNAQRAGATKFMITVTKPAPGNVDLDSSCDLVVEDDGHGIIHWQSFMTVGCSRYEDLENIAAAQDPAGIGWRCLKPHRTEVFSGDKKITVEGRGWTGAPVDVVDSGVNIRGVRIVTRLSNTPALMSLRAWFQHSPLQVFINGELLKYESFFKKPDNAHSEVITYHNFGVKVQIIPHDSYNYRDRINFFGQLIDHNVSPDIPDWDSSTKLLVEFTGETTGLRLKLPDRTGLVKNDALKEFHKAIIPQLLRYYIACDFHLHMSHKLFVFGQSFLDSEMPTRPWKFRFIRCGDYNLGSFVHENIKDPANLPPEKCVWVLGGHEFALEMLNYARIKRNLPVIPTYFHDAQVEGFPWAQAMLKVTDVEFTITRFDKGKEPFEDGSYAGGDQLYAAEKITLRVTLSNKEIYEADVPFCTFNGKNVYDDENDIGEALESDTEWVKTLVISDDDHKYGSDIFVSPMAVDLDAESVGDYIGYNTDESFRDFTEAWDNINRTFLGEDEPLRAALCVSVCDILRQHLGYDALRGDWTLQISKNGKVMFSGSKETKNIHPPTGAFVEE